jgi:hypothetical protein
MPYVGIDAFNASADSAGAPPAGAAALGAGRRALLAKPRGRRYDARLIEGLLRTVKGDSVTPVKGVTLQFSSVTATSYSDCLAPFSKTSIAKMTPAPDGTVACKACDKCMRKMKVQPGATVKVAARANKAKINGRRYNAGPFSTPAVEFVLA